jgi:hypothetical protein
VGTNRRYADAIDRRLDQRIGQMIMRGEPLTLTEAELELKVQPLTRTPRPVPVRAWVRYPSAPVQVDAEAVAWTPRGVPLPSNIG